MNTLLDIGISAGASCTISRTGIHSCSIYHIFSHLHLCGCGGGPGGGRGGWSLRGRGRERSRPVHSLYTDVTLIVFTETPDHRLPTASRINI